MAGMGTVPPAGTRWTNAECHGQDVPDTLIDCFDAYIHRTLLAAGREAYDPGLRPLLHALVRQFAVKFAAIIIAMIYTERATLARVRDGLIRPEHLRPRRQAVAALILATKNTRDSVTANAEWAFFIGADVADVNRAEVELLDALKYRLFVSPAEFRDFLLFLRKCVVSAPPAALVDSDARCNSPMMQVDESQHFSGQASQDGISEVSSASAFDQQANHVPPLLPRPSSRQTECSYDPMSVFTMTPVTPGAEGYCFAFPPMATPTTAGDSVAYGSPPCEMASSDAGSSVAAPKRLVFYPRLGFADQRPSSRSSEQ